MIEHSITNDGLASRWASIDWDRVDETVRRMQREISIASRDGESERLKDLSESFLTSFEVKARAVADVTSNESTKHPGVGEAWKTDSDRMRAVVMLDHRDYRTEPFVSFTKYDEKTRKERTMVVPTFYDRAVHQMYLMLLEPICEPLYDLRLFSSRHGRALSDAACEVRRLFSGIDAPRWVVRCDVKEFYDSMPHDAVLDCTPMDRDILTQFLKAPRIPDGSGRPVVPKKGTPTGNRLSPVIGNMILNGLEDFMRNPDDPDSGIVVRWVDDIVVTATDQDDALRNIAMVKQFLHRRGMRLNEGKSYIASIDEGFEFLKYRFVRKGDGVSMTPLDEAVDDLLASIGQAVSVEEQPDRIVSAANNRIRGFTTKYRFADMTGCSEHIDSEVSWIVNERLAQVHCTTAARELRTVGEIVPIAWTPLLLRANFYIDRVYFEEKNENDRIERVSNDAFRRIWSSTRGCCALCGLRIRRDDPRTIMECDDVRAYVHISCMDECGELGIDPVFVKRAFRDPVGPSGKRSPPLVSPTGGSPDAPPPVTSAEQAGSSADSASDAAPVPLPVASLNLISDPVSDPVPDRPPATADRIIASSTDDDVDLDPSEHPADPTEPPVIPAAVIRLEDAVRKDVRRERIVLRTKRGSVSKYQPLLDAVQDFNYPYLDISFKAISDMIGGLCSYAYKEKEWWSRKGRSTIGEALAAIGWEVGSVDMEKAATRLRPIELKLTVAEASYLSRHTGDKKEANIAERDLRIEGSRFGGLTSFLLRSEMDQIRLGFDAIAVATRNRLSEYALNDYRYWCNRRPNSPLLAIEDGDFSKVAVDMEAGWILVARTCCIPESDRGDVPQGGLRIKDHMRLRAMRPPCGRHDILGRSLRPTSR